MKKLIFASVGLLMFSLASTAAAQQELIGQTHFHGHYVEEFCAPDECVGDLVSCEFGGVLVSARGLFHFIKGICNDLDPDETNCGTSYSWYGEECFNVGSGAATSNQLGSLRVFLQRGKERYCVNSGPSGLATAACQGTPPPGEVIFEASTFSQSRLDDRNRDAGYSGETFITDVTTMMFFDPVDGKMKRIPAVSGVQHWTSEQDITRNCFVVNFEESGCGFAGTMVIIGPPPKPQKP